MAAGKSAGFYASLASENPMVIFLISAPMPLRGFIYLTSMPAIPSCVDCSAIICFFFVVGAMQASWSRSG
jgi:hypothetical protein